MGRGLDIANLLTQRGLCPVVEEMGEPIPLGEQFAKLQVARYEHFHQEGLRLRFETSKRQAYKAAKNAGKTAVSAVSVS